MADPVLDHAEPFLDASGAAPVRPQHGDWLMNDIEELAGKFRRDGDGRVRLFLVKDAAVEPTAITWAGWFAEADCHVWVAQYAAGADRG